MVASKPDRTTDGWGIWVQLWQESVFGKRKSQILASSVARRLQLESVGEEHHNLSPCQWRLPTPKACRKCWKFTKLTGTQEKTPKSPKPSIFQQEQWAKLHPGRGIPKVLPHLQVGSWNFSTHPGEKGKMPLGSSVFLTARWFYGFKRFSASTAQLLICE